MKFYRIIPAMLLGAGLIIAPQDSLFAQFGKLKDKVKKEAAKNIPTQKKATEPAPKPADTVKSSDTTKTVADSSASKGDDFQLFTKFDFVPGQRVLYYDDLAKEELGEFPSRWGLKTGVFEIAKIGKDPWIMCSARGEIYPKLNVNQLPEKYTVEFKILNRTSVYTGAYYNQFFWLGSDGNPVAELRLFCSNKAIFSMKDDKGYTQTISEIQLSPGFKSGVHDVRVMVTKSSVKCYIDNDRVANAPRTTGFTPVSFSLGFHADDADLVKEKLFFGDFRFAEGGKTMREQLEDSGHIVTHGIYFDINSATIKGESYRTLAEIGQMLTDDVALQLTIGGHTDSDGDDASNVSLSQHRAESVQQYLTKNFKIDSSRLQAKGYGESKPIDANTTPEGKANNRRVELVKS